MGTPLRKVQMTRFLWESISFWSMQRSRQRYFTFFLLTFSNSTLKVILEGASQFPQIRLQQCLIKLVLAIVGRNFKKSLCRPLIKDMGNVFHQTIGPSDYYKNRESSQEIGYPRWVKIEFWTIICP